MRVVLLVGDWTKMNLGPPVCDKVLIPISADILNELYYNNFILDGHIKTLVAIGSCRSGEGKIKNHKSKDSDWFFISRGQSQDFTGKQSLPSLKSTKVVLNWLWWVLQSD